MITQEKVNIYNSFQGDIDGWVRMGSKKEKTVMSDEDWYLIEGLIQDIHLIKNGLTSPEFSDRVLKRLEESCDSAETATQLRKIAE